MAAPQIAPGIEKEQALKLGGFSEDEISNWKADTHKSLKAGGFNDKEVNDYFGIKEPDTTDMKDYVKGNIAKYQEENKPNPDAPIKIDPNQNPVDNYYDAFKYGLQISTTGLGLRGKMPDKVMPEHASRVMNILENIGQMAGDLPAYAEGMVAGGLGGEAVAGPPGAAVGAAAVGWALPATMRKIMIDHYQKGDIKDPGDFLDRFSSASWEAIKAATTGVATEMTGGAVGLLGSKVVGPLAKGAVSIAKTTAEVGAMATTNAAMEGHLPSQDEFINAGIVVGGLHGAGLVAGNMMSKYVENGTKPGDTAIEAGKDPVVKQDLFKPLPETSEEKPPAKLYSESEDHSDAEKQVLSHIVKNDQELPTKTWAQSWQDWRTNWLDKAEPLKQAGATDAYQLFRRFGDIRSKIMSMFTEGIRSFKADGTGDVIGEAPFSILKDMMEKTGDADESKFVAYWASKRALELDARGIETPFMRTKADAVATAQVVIDGKSKYDPYVTRMVEAKNKVIDYYAEATGMDPERVQAIKDLNKAHFPFHKIQEIDALTGKVGGGSKGLKRIFGTSQDIIDPMTSTFKDMEMLIAEADKANIRRQVWDNLGPEENGGAGLLRQVETPMKKIEVSADEIGKATGIDTDGETFNIFRPENTQVGPDQAQVWVDGKRITVEGDPGIISSMKSIDGDPVHMGMWVKLLRAMAAGQRTLTVGNPMFAGRHMWRSQRSAALYSKTGMDTFITSLMNWNEASPANQMWKDFWYDGGGVSTFEGMDRDYLEQNVFKMDQEKPFLNKVWNYIKDPRQISEQAIMTSDNMSRFTEYKRTIEQGGTRAEAAYNARQVVADYQRQGAKFSGLRGTVAFLNVHMQVTDRAVTEMLENPKEFLPKVLAGITAPAILFWLADHDDDRLKESPNYMKNLYTQVPIDWFKDVKTPEDLNSFTVMPDSLKRTLPDGTRQINVGPVLKIPGEGEPFMVFGSMVRAALDSAYQKNPDVMGQWAKDALSSLIPLPIATGVKPAIEQGLNHNFLTNRSLISAQNEKQLPYERYESYTSEVAKQLGKQIGYIPYLGRTSFAAPVVIDNYIRGWTGGLGQYAVQLADAGLHTAGIGNTTPGAAWGAAEVPFLKELLVRFPDMRASSIEEFSNRAAYAEQIMNSSRKELKQMSPQEAMEIRETFGPYAPKVANISRGIAKARQAIQLTLSRGDITPDDKRQLVNTMMFQTMNMAHAGLQMMDEYEKKMKDIKEQGDQR